MATLTTQMVAFPVYPLFEKGKGNINNRLECAGQLIKNNAVGALKATAVAGTVAGVTYASYKSPVVANAITAGLKGIRSLMGKTEVTKTVADVITKALKDMPKAGKIGVIGAAISLPYLMYNAYNTIYKAGQIDQRYTDKAALYDKADRAI